MNGSLFSAVVGAIVGGVIGICAAYFSNRWSRTTALEVLNHTECNKAAATFRAAFVDVIFALEQNVGKARQMVYRIITNEILLTQEKAKIVFTPFLAKPDVEGFNCAWEEYVNCRYSYQNDPKYNDNPDPELELKEESQYYLKHIENLLNKYAKPR